MITSNKNKKNNRNKVIITALIFIIIEAVLIFLAILLSNVKCVSGNEELSNLKCLWLIFPTAGVIITSLLAIITALIAPFVIQNLRKKSMFIPIIITVAMIAVPCIYIGYIIMHEKVWSIEPEKSLKKIIHNDELYANKHINYFIHNDNIYYYKYMQKIINDGKGILFKANMNGKKSQKVCTLKYGNNFEYSFIYNDKVFYTVNDKVLKSLDLNTCEDKVIVHYDSSSNKLKYILRSKKNNEILIETGTLLHKYNLDEEKITKTIKLFSIYNYIIDYQNFDYYKIEIDGLTCNGEYIYKFDNNNWKFEILAFDKNNVYITDQKLIYVLDKTKKQIVATKDYNLKSNKSINTYDMAMNNFIYVDSKLYKYDVNSNNFSLIFEDADSDFSLFSEESEQSYINGYYFFSNLKYYNRHPKYDDSTITLYITDVKGKKIIKEINNAELYDYRIDNDKVYLIYKNNEIKKINLK